jgi:hypothetical protein
MISPNFELQDLVSEAIFTNYESESIIFIDRRVVSFLETMKRDLGTILVVNTWNKTDEYLTGLNQNYNRKYSLTEKIIDRGFQENSIADIDETKQNRYGRAIKVDAMTWTYEEIATELLKKYYKYKLLGLSAIMKAKNADIYLDFRLKYITHLQKDLIILPDEI